MVARQREFVQALDAGGSTIVRWMTRRAWIVSGLTAYYARMEFPQCRMGFSRLRAEFDRVQDGLKSILRDLFSRLGNMGNVKRESKTMHFRKLCVLATAALCSFAVWADAAKVNLPRQADPRSDSLGYSEQEAGESSRPRGLGDDQRAGRGHGSVRGPSAASSRCGLQTHRPFGLLQPGLPRRRGQRRQGRLARSGAKGGPSRVSHRPAELRRYAVLHRQGASLLYCAEIE